MSKEDKERKRAEREAEQEGNMPDPTIGFRPPATDIQDQKPYEPEKYPQLEKGPLVQLLRNGQLFTAYVTFYHKDKGYTLAAFPHEHNTMIQDGNRRVPGFIPFEVPSAIHASEVPADRELTAPQFVWAGEDVSVLRNRLLRYEQEHQAGVNQPTEDAGGGNQ